MRLTFARQAERRRSTGDAALLVAWFTLNALVVRLLCCDQQGYSSFWSANAALSAALLVLRSGQVVAVVAACLVINFALNLLKPWSLTNNALYVLLNLFQSVIAAAAARRFCGATTDLTRIRRLSVFGLIALVSACVEACVGTLLTALINGGGLLGLDFIQWICCDALGLLLAMPMTVVIAHSGLRRIDLSGLWRRRRLAGAVLPLLAAGASVVSFAFAGTQCYLLLYPCLSWLAMQFGPSLILMTIFVVSTCASALTAHGVGPMAMLAAQHGSWPGYILLQPFLITLLLTVLPANIMLAERARSERRLRRSEIRLRHASSHDPLTLLMNRWLFRRQLSAALDSGHRFALLFLDIDHFKSINDTFGHSSGDRLLQAFAGRLLSIAGECDGRAGRFGGDEFVLMVPIDSVADCARRCDGVLDILQRPYEALPGRAVTVSIGAAISTPLCHEGALIQSADEALYAAKAAGRATFRVAHAPAASLQSVA